METLFTSLLRLQTALAAATRATWRRTGASEITVDSVAEELVCPLEWGQEYETRGPKKWMRFVKASGGQMGHYGEKTATFQGLELLTRKTLRWQ